MQKSLVKLSILLGLFFVIAFGYQNCGFKTQGTDTGNPMQPGNSDPASSLLPLADRICQVVIACHADADQTLCIADVQSSPALAQTLGAPPAFTSVGGADDAVARGQITYSPRAGDACINELRAISCADPLMQSAYDSSSGSYAGVSNLIPTGGQCPSVYH